MSAMESMAKNILASMVPPEVMALITSENMQKIVTTGKAFVEQQNRIEQKLDQLLELTNNDSHSDRGDFLSIGNAAPGDGSSD